MAANGRAAPAWTRGQRAGGSSSFREISRAYAATVTAVTPALPNFVSQVTCLPVAAESSTSNTVRGRRADGAQSPAADATTTTWRIR